MLPPPQSGPARSWSGLCIGKRPGCRQGVPLGDLEGPEGATANRINLVPNTPERILVRWGSPDNRSGWSVNRYDLLIDSRVFFVLIIHLKYSGTSMPKSWNRRCVIRMRTLTAKVDCKLIYPIAKIYFSFPFLIFKPFKLKLHVIRAYQKV